MPDLVVRRVPEYGWGLFVKGTTRKAEGNAFGPWYSSRAAAMGAMDTVLASIERAHACDAPCLCAFCHGSRERDFAEALERLATNHRVLYEDAGWGGNHTPSDCATCVFLARHVGSSVRGGSS